MPASPSLCVVAATGVEIERHALAIAWTRRCLPRAASTLLLSPRPPRWLRRTVSWAPIEPLRSRTDYSRFLLFGLSDHIATDFALVVQGDGLALHRDRWDERFLSWDYIGAPWPAHLVAAPWGPGRRVGNGGFSLRSRRWLEAGRSLAPGRWRGEPEDAFACQMAVAHWEACGCRIAPLEVAQRFACEQAPSEFPHWHPRESFGCHGRRSLAHALLGLALPRPPPSAPTTP